MHTDLTRGERTRTDILQASYRLFVKQGYHGTSMRQIAEEAGIALGGIYNHFSGKEEIFETVVVDYHPIHQVMPMLEEARGETVEELVRNAARTMQAQLKERPDFFNLMFVEMVEFNARHIPGMFERIFPMALAFAGRIARAEGELRDIPLPSVLATFLGMMFSYYAIQTLLGGPTSESYFPSDFLDQMTDIFLHGILAEQDLPAEG